MKNLKSYSVTELSITQSKKINGGYWIPLIMLLGAMINDAQNNPKDFQDGMDAW
jgi:hypothetical protein